MHSICTLTLFIIEEEPGECVMSVSQTIIGKGWARTSVNATVYRRNSVASDEKYQYVAYYDADRKVMLAQREIGSTEWKVEQTQYSGNTADAHNGISIMVDGEGYLHMSWDHHVHPLRYCRSP